MSSKSPNAPTRTPRRKEGQALATRIRDAIVSGEYAIGDSLGQESQLLERFGVSRPTLREACRILEAESLIQVERGTSGGIRVRRPDRGVLSRYASLLLQYRQTTLRDVYEYRMLVEPAVARWLATGGQELQTAFSGSRPIRCKVLNSIPAGGAGPFEISIRTGRTTDVELEPDGEGPY